MRYKKGGAIMNEGESPSKPAEETCKHCGAAVSKVSRFCQSCGKSVRGDCIQCGSAVSEDDKFCPSCGADVKGRTLQNTSGQGAMAVVPLEIKKWNWGALLLHWIWGVGNKTYIMLLALIPYVGLIMAIVGGAKGSEWAWRNKRWDSIEHFQRVQKKWAMWGIGIWVGIFVLVLFSVLIQESY
jgi:RNA polymerase subunit RPABC4/transcription elongation factor Spt4